MPNWKRIKELRDDLDRPWEPASFRFNMGDWAFPEDGDATVGQIREGGCRTSCCLAGSAVLMFMPNESNTLADDLDWGTKGAEVLGLTDREAAYMFEGHWSRSEMLRTITQADAVCYLNKAIREKNIMVRL